MDTEQAAQIVSSFIAVYYGNFVRDNLHAIEEMYNESSLTTIAMIGDAVATTNRGKLEIHQSLERLSTKLGQRKVHITTADSIPTTDGSILVTVGGQMHTHAAAHGFIQSFVLANTKHRVRTLFIAAESLRFLSFEPEVIPEGAVIVAPGEEITPVEVVPEPQPVEQKPPRQPRERKPREPKAPKVAEAEPAPAVAVAVVEAAPQPPTRPQREQKDRKERAPRVKKTEKTEAPHAEVAAEAPAAAAAPKPDRPQTVTARLHEVPQTIRLSVVRAAVAKFGEVVDARWFGENSMDCLVDFTLPASAKHLVFAKGFTIEGVALKRSFFHTK